MMFMCRYVCTMFKTDVYQSLFVTAVCQFSINKYYY